MCFSAESSLAAGLALVPAGAYGLAAAARKDRAYLPVAAVPLLLGAQQLCEAGVWRGLGRDDPGLVEPAALAYLFFATAFWPAWVPLAAAALERRPRRRKWFYRAAVLGLALGAVAYLPAALHYGDWLVVRVAGHSVRYDFSRFPAPDAAAAAWEALYLGVVCVPLLASADRRLRAFGLTVAVAAAVGHVAFRYAFLSVWCFFSAVLSAHVCYALHRLPPPAGRSAGSGTCR